MAIKNNPTPMTIRGALAAIGLALALLAAPAQANAQSSDAAIGVALGSPAGLDAKWWTSRHFAFNLGLGAQHFSSHFAIYSDFEFTLGSVALGSKANSRFYFGPGLLFGIPGHDHNHGFTHHREDHVHLDVAAPFGWEVDFHFPLNLFVELRAGVGVVGHPGDFDLLGQLGARYRL